MVDIFFGCVISVDRRALTSLLGCADSFLELVVEEKAEVAKQEWGAKHVCSGCGAKFYDMGKSPIACPACEELVANPAPGRTRRSRKDEAKDKPAQPRKEEDGVVAEEADILSNEVDDLIEDEDENDAIATLADDDDDENADVLAEADIDTTTIGDE